MSTASAPVASSKSTAPLTTVFPVLFALSLCHLINDTLQALIPASYPVLKKVFDLNYSQLGLITLANQCTASVLQPFIGYFSDKRPFAYLLVLGMTSTLCGILLISTATNLPLLICGAALVGVGSSIFHPEASRIVHMASGPRYGTAQTIFQVGGNGGTSLGPLLAGLIVIPFGRGTLFDFGLIALMGIAVLLYVCQWFVQNPHRLVKKKKAVAASSSLSSATTHPPQLSPRRVTITIVILLVLVFSKYLYLETMRNYLTFFLIQKFHVTPAASEWYLFTFLFAVALGTFIGGPVGDRIGRKPVIWVSILGVAPFSMLIPFASPFWIGVLAAISGVILASAFTAIVVYAQELMPGNVGMVAGLFFGFAFGMGGLSAALLGKLADLTSIQFIFYIACASPVIGLLTWFLPHTEPAHAQRN